MSEMTHAQRSKCVLYRLINGILERSQVITTRCLTKRSRARYQHLKLAGLALMPVVAGSNGSSRVSHFSQELSVKNEGQQWS